MNIIMNKRRLKINFKKIIKGYGWVDLRSCGPAWIVAENLLLKKNVWI